MIFFINVRTPLIVPGGGKPSKYEKKEASIVREEKKKHKNKDKDKENNDSHKNTEQSEYLSLFTNFVVLL